MTTNSSDYEKMCSILEASGDYRILRKIKKNMFPKNAEISSPAIKVGVIVDIETTGLDAESDEIIELGLIKFYFLDDGSLVSIGDEIQSFLQPSFPVPMEISKITGITDAMLVGKNIDSAKVNDFIQDASLIIAHNAYFDRRFCEKKWPLFNSKPWACSLTEINWRKEGFSSASLSVLLNDYGFFHEGHRAIEDCYALLKILSMNLRSSEKSIFSQIIESSQEVTIRIWPENSPFDSKDVLKKRGYKWSGGTDTMRRSWWIDLPESFAKEEIDFLRKNVYRKEVSIPTKKLTAFERYSVRADLK